MKKITALLVLLFINTLTFAQIQKLGQLASGKIIDSRIIYEEESEDVFGYFYLYEKDKIGRRAYELGYVILDNNLNVITSNTFAQASYSTLLIKFRVYLSFVNKIDNKIIFGLHDRPKASEVRILYNYFNHRYKQIDLETFELSEDLIVQGNKMIETRYEFGDKMRFRDVKHNQSLFPISKNRFLLFAESKEYENNTSMFSVGGRYIRKAKEGLGSFRILDQNFETILEKPINTDEENEGYYTYVASDEDVLILNKKPITGAIYRSFHLMFYDLNTGDLKKEFNYIDDEYKMYYADDIKFTENEIILYVGIYGKEEPVNAYRSLGYAKYVFDKQAGEQISRDYFLWKDLEPHLQFVHEYGWIEDYGIIYPIEFLPLENDNTIVMAEGFSGGGVESTIKDLFVFELDANLRVKYLNKIEKTPYTLKIPSNWLFTVKENNLHDYGYSQKLDEDGNYVFFYLNNLYNEKNISKSRKIKNAEWILGIISYVDGKFTYDKIDLNRERSKIYPRKAKNGYIQLFEIEGDDVEVRLERINY